MFFSFRNMYITTLLFAFMYILNNFQTPAIAGESDEAYISDDKIKIMIEKRSDIDSVGINPRRYLEEVSDLGVYNNFEVNLEGALNYIVHQAGGAYRKSSYMLPCTSRQANGIAIYSATDNEEQIASINQTNGIPYICHPRNNSSSDPNSSDNNANSDSSLDPQEPIILTIQDLQELGITPTPIHQQNPPHTLKNYNTNFWAEPNPQEFHTQINGVPVTARAIPTHYTFDYGDGRKYTTTHPGYRLADDVWDEPTPTSHQYSRAGDYVFTLSTYYRGEFSVAGGPWQVMAGEGVTVSEPLLVRVWRAEVGLVAEDCLSNPAGWGCPGVG